MSERTTIGGTVYEAIGSSSSNLLLKCNGTARIQWGNKLIDLIKNGKIASENSQELVFIVSDESEIKSDGIYILTSDEYPQLWISKDNNKYNFTGTDLYISTINNQNLSEEQKYNALNNIGIYYNTLQDLNNANVQNGIVYVLDTKTLYTVKDGQIEEFEAKIKTVSIENETQDGEYINSSFKIVLSILDQEYLVLADQRIIANYSIHVKDSAQIGSENADKTQGYRLYIDGGVSYLDVDKINVRSGLESVILYKEVTYEELIELIDLNELKPQQWYLITNYQNPWKFVNYKEENNRPILVRAISSKSLYPYGYLFKNHRVRIKYSPLKVQTVRTVTEENGETIITYKDTRGMITWMYDSNHNNEANFDFLDYKDSSGVGLTTLHGYYEDEDEDYDLDYVKDTSVFPYKSYNNKLTIHDLKGTVFTYEGDIEVDPDKVNTVTFDVAFGKDKEMHDNTIECRGIYVGQECLNFSNNTINKAIRIKIHKDFINNSIQSIYYQKDFKDIDYSIKNFDNIYQDILIYNPVEFYEIIENTKIEEAKHCSFNYKLKNCILGNIESVDFLGNLENVTINEIKRPTETSGEGESEVTTIINNFRYTLPGMKNTTIDLIEQGGSIKNTTIEEPKDSEDLENTEEPPKEVYIVEDSTIGVISASTIDSKKIKNCAIKDISYATFIKGVLENCYINDIRNSYIESNMKDSSIESIYSSKIEQFIKESEEPENEQNVPEVFGIENSQIIKVSGAYINYETIKESTIQEVTDGIDFDIINGITLQGLIENSKILNFKNSRINAHVKNSTIENVQAMSVLKYVPQEEQEEPIQEENSSILTIEDSYVGNLSGESVINSKFIKKSQVYKLETNALLAGSVDDSILNTVSRCVVKADIINSTIDKISEYALVSGVVKNSQIDTISKFAEINATIENSTIKSITDSSFIKNTIRNSKIGDIGGSVIDIVIQDSTFGDISNSKLENAIIQIENEEDVELIEESNTITIYNIINNCSFNNITGSTIDGSLGTCSFRDLSNCNIHANMYNSSLNTLYYITFNRGDIYYLNSYIPFSSRSFDEETTPLLYNSSKSKEVHFGENGLSIVCIPDSVFQKGMIVMHRGFTNPPIGWGVCDGEEWEFNGIKTRTPNLINKFIKAVNVSDVQGPVTNPDLNEDGKLVLKSNQLPKHDHPHYHTFSGSDSDSYYHTISNITSLTEAKVIPAPEGNEVVSGHKITLENGSISGSIDISISGNTSTDTTESLTPQVWENTPINITPNHYALIFIMKL